MVSTLVFRSPANSLSYKQYNWETLNQRVFKGLGLSFTPQQLNNAAAAQPGAAEEILSVVKAKLESMDVPATSNSDAKKSTVKGGGDNLEAGRPSDDSIPAIHSRPKADGQAELVAHLQQTIEVGFGGKECVKRCHQISADSLLMILVPPFLDSF